MEDLFFCKDHILGLKQWEQLPPQLCTLVLADLLISSGQYFWSSTDNFTATIRKNVKLPALLPSHNTNVSPPPPPCSGSGVKGPTGLSYTLSSSTHGKTLRMPLSDYCQDFVSLCRNVDSELIGQEYLLMTYIFTWVVAFLVCDILPLANENLAIVTRGLLNVWSARLSYTSTTTHSTLTTSTHSRKVQSYNLRPIISAIQPFNLAAAARTGGCLFS